MTYTRLQSRHKHVEMFTIYFFFMRNHTVTFSFESTGNYQYSTYNCMYSSWQFFFSFSKTRSKQHPWRLIICVLLNVPIWNFSFSVEISPSSLSPQGLYNYGLNRGCWACRGLGPTFFFFLKGWADRIIIIYIHSDFVQKHVVHLLVTVYINNIANFFSL